MFAKAVGVAGCLVLVWSCAGCKSRGDAPFAKDQTWKGSYTCAQGDTNLQLKIENVTDSKVDALFDFDHTKSGSKGAFKMSGSYNRSTHKLTLTPGEWVGAHPPTYRTVGITGEVSQDGKQLAGTVDSPGCTTFKVTLGGG